MGYDKDDLHIRNISLQFAVDYFSDIQTSIDTVLETAARFEDFLRNGASLPEIRRTFNDLPRI